MPQEPVPQQQPPELTATHLRLLQRLLAEGFEPAQFPFFLGQVGVKKCGCAALLRPLPDGRFELAATPSFLVEGNLSAKVEQGGEAQFVWKQHRLQATPERLEALRRFEVELRHVLESALPV